MGYFVLEMDCREEDHGQMEYVGDGDYICPVCGFHYHDYDFDDDEDDGERLSVEDAALVWMSHGKDEDYMCGYTEEELEDAL